MDSNEAASSAGAATEGPPKPIPGQISSAIGAYAYPVPVPLPVRPAGRPFAPGWGLYGLTAACLAMGVYGSSVPNWYVPWAAAAFMGCLTLAFVWFVAFGVMGGETQFRWDRRAWARWAGMPIAVLAVFVLASSNLPSDVRFGLSQSALERAAQEAQAGRPPGPGWIGFLPVDSVTAHEDGVTTFVVSGTDCGSAWDPQGAWMAYQHAFDEWWASDDTLVPYTWNEGTFMRAVAPGWWSWCDDSGYPD